MHRESTPQTPPPPPHRPLEPQVPVREPTQWNLEPWTQLIEDCKRELARAGDAIDRLNHPAQDAAATLSHLDQGLQKVERLAEGAAWIDRALEEVSAGGLEALEESIGEVDSRINGTFDDELREVYHANRSFLVARRAKVQVLLSDRERMMASARGFLLATQNLRLDTAHMGTNKIEDFGQLTAPLERLSREVETLRKVELELSHL